MVQLTLLVAGVLSLALVVTWSAGRLSGTVCRVVRIAPDMVRNHSLAHSNPTHITYKTSRTLATDTLNNIINVHYEMTKIIKFIHFDFCCG